MQSARRWLKRADYDRIDFGVDEKLLFRSKAIIEICAAVGVRRIWQSSEVLAFEADA